MDGSNSVSVVGRQGAGGKKPSTQPYSRFHADLFRDIAFMSLSLLVITIAIFSSIRAIQPIVEKYDKNNVLPRIVWTNSVNGDVKLIEFLGFCGVIVGLFCNVTAIHSQYHQEKLNKASEYVSKWYGAEVKSNVSSMRLIKHLVYNRTVVESFCKDGKLENIAPCEYKELCDYKSPESLPCMSKNEIVIPEAYKLWQDKENKLLEKVREEVVKTLDDEKFKNDRDRIKTVLEFFEHMGQDVKLEIVDEDYLRDFFFYIITNYYEIFGGYIKHLQDKKYKSKHLYCNFIWLAERWRYLGPVSVVPTM